MALTRFDTSGATQVSPGGQAGMAPPLQGGGGGRMPGASGQAQPREGLRASSTLSPLFNWVLRVGDVLMLVAGGLLAFRLQQGHFAVSTEYLNPIAYSVLFALLILSACALYSNWRSLNLVGEVVRLTGAWTLMFGLMASYALVFGNLREEAQSWWIGWMGLSFCGAVALRVITRGIDDLMAARGAHTRTAVVVGASNDGQRLVDTLQSHEWGGSVRVDGWFSTGYDTHELTAVPQLGSVDDLAAHVDRAKVDEVWIALPMTAQDKIEGVLAELHHSTADIKFVPDLVGMPLLNHSVEQVAGLPVIHLQRTPLQGPARLVKAIEDRVLAGLILLAISPIMLVIAAAVKLSSPGPVFYRQERMSWNNRTFKMLKFRSMPVDAETGTGAVWARAGENRATRVGAFLRKTSLDELPQFINVLRGDMSIVGPRPERPVFVHEFKHQIPAYMKKHMVKAGITGWAQVNGWRGSTDLAKRIDCDLYYIENWSLGFDLKIIFMTLFKGFVHKNAY